MSDFHWIREDHAPHHQLLCEATPPEGPCYNLATVSCLVRYWGEQGSAWPRGADFVCTDHAPPQMRTQEVADE